MGLIVLVGASRSVDGVFVVVDGLDVVLVVVLVVERVLALVVAVVTMTVF